MILKKALKKLQIQHFLYHLPHPPVPSPTLLSSYPTSYALPCLFLLFLYPRPPPSILPCTPPPSQCSFPLPLLVTVPSPLPYVSRPFVFWDVSVKDVLSVSYCCACKCCESCDHSCWECKLLL